MTIAHAFRFTGRLNLHCAAEAFAFVSRHSRTLHETFPTNSTVIDADRNQGAAHFRPLSDGLWPILPTCPVRGDNASAHAQSSRSFEKPVALSSPRHCT